jgi:hypothetical protein
LAINRGSCLRREARSIASPSARCSPAHAMRRDPRGWTCSVALMRHGTFLDLRGRAAPRTRRSADPLCIAR